MATMDNKHIPRLCTHIRLNIHLPIANLNMHSMWQHASSILEPVMFQKPLHSIHTLLLLQTIARPQVTCFHMCKAKTTNCVCRSPDRTSAPSELLQKNNIVISSENTCHTVVVQCFCNASTDGMMHFTC